MRYRYATHNIKQHAKFGFTIVELLIVIVVIGVLALITLVTYNGIQERAENSNIATAVNAYSKILAMYKVEHGSYPHAEWVCLGNSDDYPASAPFSEGQCNTSSNNRWSEALANQLSPYVGSRLPYPDVKPRVVSNIGGMARGLIYDQASAHTGGRGTITYYRQGEESCPIGVLREYRYNHTVTVCNYVLD